MKRLLVLVRRAEPLRCRLIIVFVPGYRTSVGPDLDFRLSCSQSHVIRSSQSQAAGRWIPHQQGVPWHIRQSYDYFIFGEETDSVKSDAETGTASSDATTSSRDHSRNSSDNPCADGTDDVGFGAIPSDTVNDITMLRREVVIIEENMSPPQHEADGYRRSDRRIGDHHDERQKQQSQQQQQRYTELGWVSSPPIVCTICDEGFALGDRMCRLPCAHAFHVEVRPVKICLRLCWNPMLLANLIRSDFGN